MNVKVLLLATGALFLACSGVGCSDASGVADPEDLPFITAGNFHVVDNPNGITVLDDRVIFERATHQEIGDLEPGTYLVSNRQSTSSGGNPQGFLREIGSISEDADTIVVRTEPAALDDIVQQGKYNFVINSVEAPIMPTHARWGTGLSSQEVFAGPEIGFPDLNLKERKLLDVSESWPIKIKGQDLQLSVAGSLTADLTGKMVFSPSIDIGFHVEDWKLKELHTILTGEAQVEVVAKMVGEISVGLGTPDGDPLSPPPGSALALLIDGATEEQRNDYLKMLEAAGKSGKFEWPLYANTYQLPTVWLPTTPPIPVVTGLNVELKLECPVKFSAKATARWGANVTGSMDLGAQYTNYHGENAWNGISERTLQAIPVGPDITGGGGFTVGCSLKPSLALIFYGLAGPTIWLSGGARFGLGVEQKCDGAASTPTTQLYARLTSTLEAGVGAKFGLFAPGVNIELAAKDLTLFSWENDLLEHTQPLSSVQLGLCGNGCADPPDCTLGETKCTDIGTIEVCELDAGGCPVFEAHDCQSSASCYDDEQACLCGDAPACSLGDIQCNVGPTEISVCETNAVGCADWAVHACKTGAPCADDPDACAHGTSTSCNAGETRCDASGTAVETCRADGSGWSVTETCSGGVCAGAACVSCTPSWSCSGWSTCGCSQTQTRTCTDANGCGTNQGKPSESQSCDPCSGYSFYYCGATSQFPGGCSGTLYNCGSSGSTVSTEVCQFGCHVSAAGVDDYCEPSGTCGSFLDTCSGTNPCCSGFSCHLGYCCYGTGIGGMGDSCSLGSECCSGRCVSNSCCGNDSPPGCDM